MAQTSASVLTALGKEHMLEIQFMVVEVVW